MIALPPYAAMLGLEIAEAEPLLLRMPFGGHLIGAPGRLHGGALAGMLELAGLLALRTADRDPAARFKPVSVTVDYLREGAPRDCFAAAEMTKLGRRVANLRVVAWQEARERPVAQAHMNVIVERS